MASAEEIRLETNYKASLFPWNSLAIVGFISAALVALGFIDVSPYSWANPKTFSSDPGSSLEKVYYTFYSATSWFVVGWAALLRSAFLQRKWKQRSNSNDENTIDKISVYKYTMSSRVRMRQR